MYGPIDVKGGYKWPQQRTHSDSPMAHIIDI